jgi:hypothetical protein
MVDVVDSNKKYKSYKEWRDLAMWGENVVGKYLERAAHYICREQWGTEQRA